MTDNVVSCSLILISNGCSPSNHMDAFIFMAQTIALTAGSWHLSVAKVEFNGQARNFLVLALTISFVTSLLYPVRTSWHLPVASLAIRLRRQASVSRVLRRHSNGNDDPSLCPCWCGRNNLRKISKSLHLSGSLQYKKEPSCSVIDSRQAEHFGLSKKVSIVVTCQSSLSR